MQIFKSGRVIFYFYTQGYSYIVCYVISESGPYGPYYYILFPTQTGSYVIFIQIKIQSSNTPGYQKVQQGEQQQSVNVYVNSPIKTNLNVEQVGEEIKEEKNNEWWQSVVASLITDVVSNAVLGGILKGVQKHKANKPFNDCIKEIKDKKPDFSKDQTIDQSLVKHNQYTIGLQDIKSNFIQGIEENGGYENLNDEGKRQYNEVLNKIAQSQYESEKNLINRWSYNEQDKQRLNEQINEQKEQLNLFEEWQQNGDDYIKEKKFKYTPELNERINKQAQKLNMSDEELKEKLFQDQPLEFVSQEEAHARLFYDDYDTGLQDNEVQFNKKRDQNELNKLQQDIQKEKQKQFNDNMKKINDLQDQDLNEEYKKVETQEKELQSGVYPQLYSWIEEMQKRTDNQYTPDKQGLLNYIYDYHNKKDSNGDLLYQGGPFDGEIYRYNRYDGNDPQLVHREAENLKETLTQSKDEIKYIAQTALDQSIEDKDKMKKINEKLNQIIPENVQDELNLKPFMEQLEQGTLTQQSFLDQLSKSIKALTEKTQQAKQQYFKPVQEFKQSLKQDDNILDNILGGDNTSETLNIIDTQSDKLLSELNKLSSYIQELSEGKKQFKFSDTLNYLQQKKASINNSLNELNKAITQINDFSQKGLIKGGAKVIDKISGKNLTQYLTQMNQMVPKINKILTSIVELPTNGPKQLLKEGYGLIQDAILTKASKHLSQDNLNQIKGLFQDADNLITKIINKDKKATYGIPLSGYQVLEQKAKKLDEMSMIDIKDLLSSDLQEQEQLVKDAKDKANIFWRNNLKAPNGEPIKQYTENMKAPTEKEFEDIKKLQDEINDLQTDEQFQESLNLMQLGNDVDEKTHLLESVKQDYEYDYENDKTLNNFKLLEQQNQNQIDENIKEIRRQYDKMNETRLNQGHVNSRLQVQNQTKNELNQLMKNIETQKQNYNTRIQQLEEERPTGWSTEKKRIQQQIQNLDGQNKRYQNQLKDLNPKINQNQIQLNKLRDDVKYSENYIQQKQQQLIKLQEKNNELRQQINSLESFYTKQIDDVNKDIERFKQYQGGKLYNGKLYSQQELNQRQKQINDTISQINQLNGKLKRYEPQLNYLNNKKFQGNLSKEIRQEIEESFHAQNRQQEEDLYWIKDKKISPYVPIPTTVPAFFKPVKYKPDTEIQSRLKLQKLGYDPEKSYSFKHSMIKKPKDSIELSFNQNVQDELNKLYNETQNKLLHSKSYQWKDIINDYNQQYNNIINKHKNEMTSNETNMLISQLIQDKPKNRQQVRDAASQYYDKWNRSRKNKDKFKYNDYLNDLQQQKIPDDMKKNNFISQIDEEYNNLIYEQLNRQNVNKINEFYHELGGKELQQEIGPKEFHSVQDINQYIQQYPEQIQREYQPKQLKQGANNLYYPYFTQSFELIEENKVPYDNYLYDLGLEDVSLNHRGFLWEDNQLQQQKIQQAIQDDIIPKYNGDNKNMQKVRDVIMLDPQKYRIAQTSDLYNTQELHKRINNLKYLRRNQLEK